MSSPTEIAVHPLRVEQFLEFLTILMPVFQRPYRWGESSPRKKLKALEYFTEFLIARDANPFFGSVFVHSSQRYDPPSGKGLSEAELSALEGRARNITLYLSDGQHRIATVVLAAIAVKQALISARQYLDPKDNLLVSRLLKSEVLATVPDTNIQAIVNEHGAPQAVHEYIHGTKQLLEAKKVHRELRKAEHQVALNEAKRGRSARKNSDRSAEEANHKARNKAEIQAMDASTKALASQPLYASYMRIADFLANGAGAPAAPVDSDDSDYLTVFSNDPASAEAELAELCDLEANTLEIPEQREAAQRILSISMRFVARIAELECAFIILQPRLRTVVSTTELDAEAFAMFKQMNGDATPLDIGELFGAFLASRGRSHPIFPLLAKDSSVLAALGYFNIKHKSDIVAFLASFASHGKGDSDLFVWVRSNLYESRAPEQTLNLLEKGLIAVESARRAIAALPAKDAALFDLFFASISRQANVVFLTRFFCLHTELGPSHDELMRLLKVLMLFEIALLKAPDSDLSPCLAEDLAALPGTLTAASNNIIAHFHAPWANVADKVQALLSVYPVGKKRHRPLAKLLLVIADANKSGSEVIVSSWRKYQYEHVLPQNFRALPDNETLPDAILAELEDLIKMPDATAWIERLGNGALLAGGANASLSDKSPHEKLAATVTDEHANAWWGSHLQDLQESKGNWAQKKIKLRSGRLARDIAKWLVFSEPSAPINAGSK